MNILIISLLIAFILIIIPLFLLMNYLLTHATFDIKTSEMRKIIFMLSFSKNLFIIAQIILVLTSVYRPYGWMILVTWVYSGTAFFLAGVDWWALFKIRNIIN